MDRLRRCVRLANNTNEAALDGFTPAECVRLLGACIESDFDITPDDLTPSERRSAAHTGRLGTNCLWRLKESM